MPRSAPPLADDTRAKLLDAAGEMFAERGFHGVTVREICERAGANVAAVNYHFRDKLSLYVAVFRSSLPKAESEALDYAVLAAPPAEQLGRFLHSFLHRLLGQGRPTWWPKLMAREMAQPSAALTCVIDEAVRPNERRLRTIIAGILRCPDDDERVRLCVHSVISQCLHYMHVRPVLAVLWPDLHQPSPERVEQLAAHITEFSLAALTTLARAPQPCSRRDS